MQWSTGAGGWLRLGGLTNRPATTSASTSTANDKIVTGGVRAGRGGWRAAAAKERGEPGKDRVRREGRPGGGRGSVGENAGDKVVAQQDFFFSSLFVFHFPLLLLRSTRPVLPPAPSFYFVGR